MKNYIFFLTVFFSFFLCGSDAFEEDDSDFYRIEDIIRTANHCPNHWPAILTINKFYEAINFQDYDTLSKIMQKKILPNDAELYIQAKIQYAESYIAAHIYPDQKMIDTLHLGIENGWSPIANTNITDMLTWAFQQETNIIERFLWDKHSLKYITQVLARTHPINESLIQSILFKFARSKNIEYFEIFTETSPDFPSAKLIGLALQKASENGWGRPSERLLHKIFTHENTHTYVNVALSKAASNNHAHMIPYFLPYLEQTPAQGENILLTSLKKAISKKNKEFTQKVFETKYRPKQKDTSDLLKIKTSPEIRYILKSKLLFLGELRSYFGF